MKRLCIHEIYNCPICFDMPLMLDLSELPDQWNQDESDESYEGGN